MAPPKQRSLMEQLGFSDPELKTPQHDAIVTWLDDNAHRLFDVEGADGDWAPEHVDRVVGEAARYDLPDRRTAMRLRSQLPRRGPKERVRTRWETPVENRRGFVVGYIDLCVEVQLSVLVEHQESSSTPVMLKRGWHTRRVYWCEVKSKIESLGELFRQLRTYSLYREAAEIVVVSPDARCRERIEAQGFGFIEAPSVVETRR